MATDYLGLMVYLTLSVNALRQRFQQKAQVWVCLESKRWSKSRLPQQCKYNKASAESEGYPFFPKLPTAPKMRADNLALAYRG